MDKEYNIQVGLRLFNRRKELSLTRAELGKRLSLHESTIKRYEDGEIKSLDIDKIKEFAKALGTTPAYLMGWDNEQPTKEIDYSSIPGIMPLPYSSGKTVPLIGDIACGTPILADENIEKEVRLPEDISADFCLRCKGDSMINARIYDGDIVFIRQQPSVENGEIAAVLIDDTADIAETTLKRVYIYDSKVMLVAENPKYPPLSFEKEEMNSVRILGKAVAFLSGVR